MLIETTMTCPQCGESWSIPVDTSQGNYETIDDCAVCCRPMKVWVECEPGEVFSVHTEAA